MMPTHLSGHLTIQFHRESASGANLFTAYCASIELVIPPSITINGFANDHSIRKSFDADSQDQSLIQSY